MCGSWGLISKSSLVTKIIQKIEMNYIIFIVNEIDNTLSDLYKNR